MPSAGCRERFWSERCSRLRVEEQGVAGLHLDVHERACRLQDLLHPLAVGPGLVAGQDVVDPPAVVRAANHLQAAVLAGARSTAMKTLTRSRQQHAVLVPVAVILVPRPRPADLGVLHDHLRVVVVDLAAEDLLADVAPSARSGRTCRRCRRRGGSRATAAPRRPRRRPGRRTAGRVRCPPSRSAEQVDLLARRRSRARGSSRRRGTGERRRRRGCGTGTMAQFLGKRCSIRDGTAVTIFQIQPSPTRQFPPCASLPSCLPSRARAAEPQARRPSLPAERRRRRP